MEDTDVMIVEDEPITAMEIQSTLENLGCSVNAIEKRGNDALETLKGTPVDLVLMDINLKGDLDGIEVAKKIRKDFSIPIIYLTAYSDQDTLERARETEPEGYLVKPITEDDLVSTIRMALARSEG